MPEVVILREFGFAELVPQLSVSGDATSKTFDVYKEGEHSAASTTYKTHSARIPCSVDDRENVRTANGELDGPVEASRIVVIHDHNGFKSCSIDVYGIGCCAVRVVRCSINWPSHT